ncbi:MAG: degQ, partial [Acidimicrobiales bacterium]|nr:degQ [Acidimicrobiales bacterium]
PTPSPYPPAPPTYAPTGPPTYASPYPPAFGGPPPHPPTPRREPMSPRGRLGLAVFVIAALMGVLGYGFGRYMDSAGSPSTAAFEAAAPSTPVTQPAPLSGSEREPVAAVARVLSPAAVQINTSSGLGSGFIYDKSGLIMTASHVTGGAKDVQVRLADGTRLSGQVLGEDTSTDIAVIKISSPNPLPVAVLATGVKLQVGEMAVAIGSPFGLQQTVTAGIVSAIGRSTQTPGGVVPAIQTDAPINPGNSGGALANAKGQVIGINDSIANGGSSAQSGNVGVGFAIPIDIAKPVADKLAKGEVPTEGFLGVRGANAMGSRSGALLTNVEAASPAASAGLRNDDVVTAVDGVKVESMIDLAAVVRTHAPGDTVTVTFLRGGTAAVAHVTLTKAPPGN